MTSHVWNPSSDAKADRPVIQDDLYQILSRIEKRIEQLERFGSGSISTAPSGAAGGVLSGFYPNPGFAIDMATQAELAAALDGLNLEDYATVAALTAAVTTIMADPRWTDSRSPNGPAGGVLNGTYPNPGFAVDMATQAELNALQAIALLDGDPAGGDLKGTYPNPVVDKLTDPTIEVDDDTQIMWLGTPNSYRDYLLAMAGIVAYWPFTESGASHTDLVGGKVVSNYGAATLLRGQPSLIVSGDPSVSSTDGRAALATAANDSSFAFGGSFSVCCWFKPTGINDTNDYGIMELWRAFDAAGWRLRAENAGSPHFLFQRRYGWGLGNEISAPCTLGTVYCVIATYSAPNLRLYLNGALIASDNTASGGNVRYMGDQFKMGVGDGGGVLTAPSIFNRELTPTEVTAIYNLGHSGPSPIADAGWEHPSFGVIRTRKQLQVGNLRLDPYVVGALPLASANTGAIIYVSNAAVGQKVQFSDGTSWLPVSQLGAGSVTNPILADDSVDARTIAPDAVGSSEIQPDAVTQSELGPLAVGTPELIDGAVTPAKAAGSSPGAGKYWEGTGAWTVPASGSGHTIADEGTPLTARTTLDFQGAGVNVTDGGTKTIVTIPGGGGGGSVSFVSQAMWGTD